MALEQIAALFEIAASLAVVVSLVFVGIQLARGNREARTATLQAAMFREIDNSFQFAAHAGTWDKVISGAELAEGVELRRALALFNAYMTDCEYRFQQFRAGLLGAQTWDARCSTMPPMLDLPIYPVWRRALSGRNHSLEFLALLDSLRDEQAAMPEREAG